MKVLIVFNGKYPSIGAAQKRIRNYIIGLKYAGVDSNIISLTIEPGKKYYLYIQVMIFPIIVLVYLLKHKPKADIFLVYGFGWISKMVIIYYTHLYKSKIVFEVNEKPYSIRQTSKYDKITKYFGPFNLWCLTRIVYPKVDGFIVISSSLFKFVSKYVSKKRQIIKIPILVDYNYYANYQATNNEFKKPYFVHSAIINDSKDGITDVFKALSIIHNMYKIPLHFYLTNKTGPKKIIKNINGLIEQNKLEPYVHFLNYPDEETLIRYQASSNFCVINKTRTEQNEYNFATKIGEYLALGVPIITTKIGEVQYYLEDKISCLFILKSSPEIIAEKMVYLINNQEIATKIGLEGKNAASKYFDLKKQTLYMKNYFIELTNSKS